MNAKEFIEKEKNAIFYGFDSSEKAFTLNEVLKWMEGYATHKLASDGDLACVRLSSLIDDWFNKQVEYEKVASNSDSWKHQIRFNAKAQATRDCWKELKRIIEDEA